jgi:hypothetical protein
MPDTIVKLGDFVFENFEIPEKINFGGKQQTVVHRLPGGRRVVDVMGRDDTDLEWAGVLTGPEALERARQLDVMRVGGKPQTLLWAKFRYKVILSDFEADFYRWYQIPYRLTCTIIRDVSAGNTVDALNLDADLKGDLETAKGLAEKIGDGTISSALNSIDSAISTVTSIATTARTTIQAILTPIVTIQQRVSALIASTSNTLLSITTLGGLVPNNPISQQIQKANTAVAGFSQLGNLYQMQSIVGRMDSTLSAAAGLSSTIKTVQAAGGDLFSIASTVYGDATKWTGLATANNLSDPVLTGVSEIKVPAAVPDTGGVLGK